MFLNLLKRKYFSKSFVKPLDSGRGGSWFWQRLHALKDCYEKGKACMVESGGQARFWEDVWMECPLKTAFSNLFRNQDM